MLLTCLAGLNSCVVVGRKTHFERDLSVAEKRKVVCTTEDKSICDLENDSLVYAVSGEQLKNCITQYDKVLVYYWDPHCSADACHPLSAMQYFPTKSIPLQLNLLL